MRIGKLFGIDIFVNLSWFFVFALVAWFLASNVWPVHAVSITPLQRSTLAVLTSLLFFVSVLLHELAHSLIARARGIPIKSITLFMFGGVSNLEREADSAPSEIWISLVGPLISMGLYLFFNFAASWLTHGHAFSQPPVRLTDISSLTEAYALSFSFLGIANLLLAIFNLLPAYPLDGGRILHGVLWRITNSRRFATGVTVAMSRLIAGIIVCFGIIASLRDSLEGGFWLTFIGWFLFKAGEAERVASRLSDALGGHTAAELAAAPTMKLPANTSAADALSQLLQHQINAAPIYIDERCIGTVTLQDLVRVPEPNRTYVTAAMTPADEFDSILATADAAEVTRRLSAGNQTMLPVIDAQGEILGFITREGIVDWMAKENKKAGVSGTCFR